MKGEKEMRSRLLRHLPARLLLGAAAVLILSPMVLTVLFSFFSPEEITAYMSTRNNFRPGFFMEIRLIPHRVSLVQYYQVLISDRGILHYFVNSALYALLIVAGQLLILPSFAFALSCFRFRGRNILAFTVVLLMVLPFQVTMVPNVLTLRELGLLDTRWAIVLPMMIWPFGAFLLRQYMLTIPRNMLEASQLDGAGAARSFLHIVLPVSRPVIGAMIALSFAECWNIVEQPLAYLKERTDLHPLSVILGQLSDRFNGMEFAGAVLFMLPSLFIYLFFQQDISDGIRLTDYK